MDNYKLRKLLAEAAFELGSESDRRARGTTNNHQRLVTALLDVECELRKEAEAPQQATRGTA